MIDSNQKYDNRALLTFISGHPDKPLFFCDTSFFGAKTDNELYSTLLTYIDRLVIIPSVLAELRPWLASNPKNPMAVAINGRHPAIRFYDMQTLEDAEIKALEYYVNLLWLRTTALARSISVFERTNGRPPESSELQQIKGNLQRFIRQRGFMVAKKGAMNSPHPQLYTDELLVYLATTTAICTGRSVVILTKDNDLHEQLYKLQWLLNIHYRAMLLADIYIDNPERFVVSEFPSTKHAERYFYTHEGSLINQSQQLLEDILPHSPKTVVVECMTIGERMSRMTWCTEQEMKKLVIVKGKTRGLNTDKLNDRNCHILLPPLYDVMKHTNDVHPGAV